MSGIYTPDTLAERWGCSGKKVRLLILSGELRAFRLGERLIRFKNGLGSCSLFQQSARFPVREHSSHGRGRRFETSRVHQSPRHFLPRGECSPRFS